MANNTAKITEHLKALTALEKLKAEEEAVIGLLDGRSKPPEEYEFHIGHKGISQDRRACNGRD